MSVYIKGMEMPKCHFKTSETYNVHGFWMVYPDGTSKLHIMVDSNHWECDIIPVPDHGRLIDADALCGTMFIGEQCLYLWDEIEDAIDHAPTIIPASEEDGE